MSSCTSKLSGINKADYLAIYLFLQTLFTLLHFLLKWSIHNGISGYVCKEVLFEVSTFKLDVFFF